MSSKNPGPTRTSIGLLLSDARILHATFEETGLLAAADQMNYVIEQLKTDSVTHDNCAKTHDPVHQRLES